MSESMFGSLTIAERAELRRVLRQAITDMIRPHAEVMDRARSARMRSIAWHYDDLAKAYAQMRIEFLRLSSEVVFGRV